jgi:hypothetical protein
MSYQYLLPLQDAELRETFKQLLDPYYDDTTDDAPPTDPQIRIKTINEKANKLLELNVLDGYLAKGIMASINADVKAVHSYHQQALERFSRKSEILASYATSLAGVGYFSPAVGLILEAYYQAPASIEYLAEAIHLCGLAGRFHLVAELHRLWRKIRSDDPPYYTKILEELLELMREQQVTDDHVELIINVALTTLREHDFVVTPEDIMISLDYDDGKWFHYGIKINDTLDMAIVCQKIFDEKWYRVHLPMAARMCFIPVYQAQIFGQPKNVSFVRYP